MTIPEKIKAAISDRKLKKNYVANQLGIARPTLDDYILGRTKIAAEDLAKLADLCNVPVEYFYENKSSSFNAKKISIVLNVDITGKNDENFSKILLHGIKHKTLIRMDNGELLHQLFDLHTLRSKEYYDALRQKGSVIEAQDFIICLEISIRELVERLEIDGIRIVNYPDFPNLFDSPDLPDKA